MEADGPADWDDDWDDSVWDALAGALGPLVLPRDYCPVDPTVKQDWFLRRNELEVFFGGAAGPGKSWGLLMASLQYVDVAPYHALLLRPTLTEFEQPGGLIEVSHNWLVRTDAHWNGTDRAWTFPSGASVRFGYLANFGDLRRYKGPSYSFCGFDELTGFPEAFYRAMFRILRQAKGELDNVPLRMRGASNPGDIGHVWVKNRFVDPATREPDAVYVPAWITDNPHLDYEQYLKSLAHLLPVDRERLIRGDWDVTEEGGKFRREDFVVVEQGEVPTSTRACRYWDLAATEPSQQNPDPDWTVGVLLELDQGGMFTIRDIVRERVGDAEVEQLVRATAEIDGRGVPVFVEQDPGQAGKAQVSHYKRDVLRGFACYSGMTRINGVSAAKEVRARPAAAAVGNRLVRIVRGPNMRAFLDELAFFPMVGQHDDCVDSFSGAHNALTGRAAGARGSVSSPNGRIAGVEPRGFGTSDLVGRSLG